MGLELGLGLGLGLAVKSAPHTLCLLLIVRIRLRPPNLLSFPGGIQGAAISVVVGSKPSGPFQACNLSTGLRVVAMLGRYTKLVELPNTVSWKAICVIEMGMSLLLY